MVRGNRASMVVSRGAAIGSVAGSRGRLSVADRGRSAVVLHVPDLRPVCLIVLVAELFLMFKFARLEAA